jgi:hypothetical protein
MWEGDTCAVEIKYNRWTAEIEPNAEDASVQLAGQMQRIPIRGEELVMKNREKGSGCQQKREREGCGGRSVKIGHHTLGVWYGEGFMVQPGEKGNGHIGSVG